MSYLLPLATLAGVHLLAAASPGPAVLSTIQTSVSSPRRTTLLHVVGLGLAVATWALATLVGLEALLVRVSSVFRVLQAAGGLYLLYVGVQSWRHARDPLPGLVAGEHHESAAGRRVGVVQALRRGYMTNISNPKVMVFFASIFTVVLAPSMPVWARAAAIGIVFFNETMWNGALGMLLSTARAQRAYARAKMAIDRSAGAVMGLFGLRLVYGAYAGGRRG